MIEAIEFKYRWVGPAFRCAYCGIVAGDIDHTVPRSHVREHVRAYSKNWFPKVTCCKECNATLGAFVTVSFAERKAKCRAYIESKYKKKLAAQVWGNDELAKVGYTLRTKIQSSKKIGEWAAARIAFASMETTRGVPEDLFGQFIAKDEFEFHATMIRKIVA